MDFFFFKYTALVSVIKILWFQTVEYQEWKQTTVYNNHLEILKQLWRIFSVHRQTSSYSVSKWRTVHEIIPLWAWHWAIIVIVWRTFSQILKHEDSWHRRKLKKMYFQQSLTYLSQSTSIASVWRRSTWMH